MPTKGTRGRPEKGNDTFTVNYNFQSSTPIYFLITISPGVSPILPTSLPSPPLNYSPVTVIDLYCPLFV